MMSRAAIAFSLSCVIASAADAKQLCIRITGGTFGGSQLVLKNVKTSPRTFGPLRGYYADYSFTTESFSFLPIYGSSIANATGELGLAIVVPHVFFQGTGGIGIGPAAPLYTINLACLPGSDGNLGALDTCSGILGFYPSQIISCSDSVAIPTQ